MTRLDIRPLLAGLVLLVVASRCGNDVKEKSDINVEWVRSEQTLQTKLEQVRSTEAAVRHDLQLDTAASAAAPDTVDVDESRLQLARQLDTWRKELDEIGDMIASRKTQRTTSSEAGSDEYEESWKAAQEDYRRSEKRLDEISAALHDADSTLGSDSLAQTP